MKDPLRIYIVEDEPLISETIQIYLTKEGYEVVGSADSIGEAFFEIDSLQPDLVFLDITLGTEQKGIELGRKLQTRTEIPFIYLTSHSDDDTIREAATTNPAGYLLKPFKSKDLRVAIEVALLKLNTVSESSSEESDSLFVKDKKRWVRVNYNEILVAKADDTYTEIYTSDQRYLISQPLKKVEEKLPGKTFKRVQRSYVVNLSKITAIEDDLLIIGEHLIPMGKKYRTEVMEVLKFL